MKPLTPQNELYEKLALLGWSLSKIDYRNGVYIAKADNETTGQEIERTAKSPELALASVYQYAVRASQVRRHAALQKLSAWNDHWTDRIEDIANAYSKLPVFDEKAVDKWKALAAESKVQADAIRRQIKVTVVDDPEPYPNAQAMCEDVHKNKNFLVSRANSEHPLWTVDDNVNFRIVHDVIGHCQSGGDFSWKGENLACGVHFPLVSPEAREALFTECLGQTGYGQHFHGFGPQKIGLMNEFLHPAQAKEGEKVWIPHGGLPELTMAPNQNAGGTMDQAPGMAGIFQSPGQWVQPSPVFTMPGGAMQGYTVQAAKMVSPNRAHDPNAFWNPPTQVPPISDPTQDYINVGDTFSNAAKIDTEWQNEDEGTQERAIMNAFRVALLSPRKHLRWNAAHYQALMHADPSTKAVDLWDMLEKEREKHNQSLGYPEGSHLAYRRQLDFLAHELQVEDPSLSEADARTKAKHIVFEKTKEFEAALGPELGEASELKRYNQARKLVTQWLQENYTPVRGWQPGQLALASSDWKTADIHDDGLLFSPEEFGGWQTQDASGFADDSAKYGAFMGAHLDGIEQVGRHIKEIRAAALEDLKHGGKGFHFRNTVMNMNLPGVNPKVASFAWLLLAPLTSELGIIDTHVIRGLRRTERDMNPRDYYKMERMQRAGKDATGYSHMPLGLYHWGLWDLIRNPGEHSDHSPLRVLDPLPWDSPDAKWDAASNAKSGPWVGPMAFENGRGEMERAANDFDAQMAGQPPYLVPHVEMPGQPGFNYLSKI